MVRCLPSTDSSAAAAAGEITSIYATDLGTITLTWSRASLGIFLLADLRLTPATENNQIPISDHLRLRLRPYLKWKRKGSKRYRFVSPAGRGRVVEVAWDLSLATFSRSRGPEPTGKFFLSISVDGEIGLVVGDRDRLISKRERVRFGGMGGEMCYETKGRFEGKEMEISIRVDVEEGVMSVGIDGEVVLEVRRLCWKFRGREGAGLKGGGRVQVAWDLHDWFFRREEGWERSPPAAAGEKGEAVFVLRFQREEEEEGVFLEGRGGLWKREWSDSSSGSEEEEEMRSFGGEEGGFSLLVYGRKR